METSRRRFWLKWNREKGRNRQIDEWRLRLRALKQSILFNTNRYRQKWITFEVEIIEKM